MIFCSTFAPQCKEPQNNNPLPLSGNGPIDLGLCWWAILGLNQ
jgi:hypothetical protein